MRLAAPRSLASLVLLSCSVVAWSGCAVAMAARQPTAKNLDVLKPGTERTAVVAELGWPLHSETGADGRRSDYYTITQGYSKGAKVSRVLLHGIADTLTLGTW